MLFARSLVILNTAFLVAVAMISASPARAEDSVQLSVAPEAGQNRRVTTLLEARGDLKLKAEKDIRRLPLEVRGDLRFTERLVEPTKSVRMYEKAAAKIRIGEGGAKPSLRSQRTLVLAKRSQRMEYKAAQGPLEREELDLLRTQGDPLAVAELLPGKTISVGESWEPESEIWAKVLAIDSVTESDVSFRLTKVEGEIALISFEGVVDGAIGGVATEMRLRGKINFNTRLRDITWFAMTNKENRAIGLAEPGVDASSRLRVEIQHVPPKPEISPSAVAGLPSEFDATTAILEFRSKPMAFQLVHEPRWRLMIERPNVVIFRMVDDGVLLAQGNISRLATRPADKPFKMDEFQRDIQSSLDKNFGQFVEKAEYTTDAGLSVLRVTVSGMVQEVPIQWIYYHLTSPEGGRLTLAFTMAAKQAEAFGAADRTFVNAIEIQPLPEPTTAGSATASGANSDAR